MLQRLKPNSFVFFTCILFLKFNFLRYLLYGTLFPIWPSFVELSLFMMIFILLEQINNNKIKTTIYLTINFILSALAFACIVYFQYFETLPTIFSFSAAGQVGALTDSILTLIKPSFYLFFIDFVLLAGLYFWKKQLPFIHKKYTLFPVLIIIFLTSSLTYSQFMVTKQKQVADIVYFSQLYGVLNYEYLMIDKFIEDKFLLSALNLEKEQLKEEILEIKNIDLLPKRQLQYYGIGEDKNLLIVQLESFQNLFINLEIEGEEVTPFINQLMKEGLYFTHMYQQVGPGNTSDSEFMVNTSIFPEPYEPTSLKHGDKIFADSLPNLLNESGYVTLTAHTNDVTFWNRNNLYPNLGFSKYYDKAFYKDEDFIQFGASDEVLYTKTIPELQKIIENNQNFYAHFIAVSSHYPYTLPEDKQLLDLPSELNGTFLGDLLQSMRYVDYTVELLVNELKDNGMWDNTVFVMYGDHSALQAEEQAKEIYQQLKKYTGDSYPLFQRFNIPLFIHDTAIAPEQKDTLVGQIDIMPTIANLMGMDLSDKIIFGQDVINYPANTLGYRYYVPAGSFITDELFFMPKSGFEDGTAYLLEDSSKTSISDEYIDIYDRMLKLYDLGEQYLKTLPSVNDTTEETSDLSEK